MHDPVNTPFERIVEEHGALVLRVCRVLLDPSDAEDAWAETFLAALKAYPRLDESSDVKAWLVTIAHRKAIDSVRARARRPAPVAVIPETPAKRRRDDTDMTLLHAALDTLPRRQREAVALHHVAGLPYKVVAVMTGSSVAAVRRAAADGIASLRSRIPNPSRRIRR
jgi:RNA polymerase sigma factor (sigma-70 family)